ncbi:MAG TPA: CHAD domain-containing protein [Solirubrobacterales bacterium]|nr:CHAD domain-containing protein [Solirubrobacterales bacterium]
MAEFDGSRAYVLRRDEPLAEALRAVAAGRAEKALERLREGAGGETDLADAIHGARKDMKKLRTVLRLLRGHLPKRVREEENGRYRDAGRALSASRDAEVKVGTLESLAEHAPDLPEKAVEVWRQILARDRDAAAHEDRIEEAITLIEAGREGIAGWSLEGDSWKIIGAGLERVHRGGRRALRATEAEPGEANVHEWRKRVKDLRYALEFIKGAWPGPLKATAEEAHALTDLLGEHHDLAVLREDLRQRRLGEEETQALEAVIDARQRQLVSEALPLGRRLYAERPKALDRRLRRYWEAWRG